MRPDPSHEQYLRQWAQLYERLNYDQGLAGYFLGKSHVWCERAFGPETHFGKVLEVGAGTGVHLSQVRHGFDEYIMTDLNPPMLAEASGSPARSDGRVTTRAEDATALSFPDASFDRLIA